MRKAEFWSWLSSGQIYYFDVKKLRFSHCSYHEPESTQHFSKVSAGGWRINIALAKHLHVCGVLVLRGKRHQKKGIHC